MAKPTPSSPIWELHGSGVVVARGVIKFVSLLSTRGPFRPPGWITDWLVIVLAMLSIGLALAVNSLVGTWLITAAAVYSVWRIYDITCNYFAIIIVDRSEVPDPGYKSAVRSFALGGLNLFELVCCGFLVETFLVTSGEVRCLFSISEDGFDARAVFLENLYRATDLSSLDPACVAQSTWAFAFAFGFTVSIATLVLIMLSRAIATIPFRDRSGTQPLGPKQADDDPKRQKPAGAAGADDKRKPADSKPSTATAGQESKKKRKAQGESG